MDAIDDAGAVPAAAPGAGLVAHLRSRLKSSRELDRVLSSGLARLVETQLRFADELGLARAQVLPAAERFRDVEPEAAIKHWLADPQDGAAALQALLDDLVAHHAALNSALDGVMLEALDEELARADSAERRGLPLWLRVVRLVQPQQQASERDLRYLHLVAPAFVAAYLRARRAEP